MPPLSLLIKPASGNCQYRCKYCFYADVMAHRQEKDCSIMSRDTLETLVRRALSYGEGSVTFSFQGGEPTLAGLDFYRELVRLEKKHRRNAQIYNCLQTNGGLIDEEWAAFLRDNHFLVGLSMDGNEMLHDRFRMDAEGKGTFARTERAANLFAEYGVEFNILCVVNHETVDFPEEVYESLKKYRFLQFIPCIDDFELNAPRFAPSAQKLGEFLIKTFDLYERDIMCGEYTSVRTFDNYIQMLRTGRPESCAMMGRCSCYFVIDAGGEVYPCDFYCLDEWKLGNIREAGFMQLASSEQAKQFVASSVCMDPACRKCAHYSLCRGGCRRDREPFDEWGRPSLNKYCEGYKMFFKARGEALRKLARRQ